HRARRGICGSASWASDWLQYRPTDPGHARVIAGMEHPECGKISSSVTKSHSGRAYVLAVHLQRKRPPGEGGLFVESIGRGDRIRTCDFYVPNVALYQAELHPDSRAANCSDSCRECARGPVHSAA